MGQKEKENIHQIFTIFSLCQNLNHNSKSLKVIYGGQDFLDMSEWKIKRDQKETS